LLSIGFKGEKFYKTKISNTIKVRVLERTRKDVFFFKEVKTFI